MLVHEPCAHHKQETTAVSQDQGASLNHVSGMIVNKVHVFIGSSTSVVNVIC